MFEKNQTPRLGWVGTGVMGRSMATNLIQAGYPMTVTSRTRSKADSLLEIGAKWADSPADVAEVSDVVFVMVGYPEDVRSVILEENGVLSGFLRAKSTGNGPKTVVDMTTSRPRLAEEIFEICRQKGIESLDAPVSGGDIGAKNGTLSIMVGGEKETVTRLTPLFSILGQTVVRQGGAGRGQHAKMVNQILIAGNMAGICEALLYAFKAGLDMKRVFQSVEKGAAGSWSLSHLGPRILKGDFAPGFFIEHFIKDMGIALDEAKRMNLSLPSLDLVRRLYQAVADAGGAKDGTQALIKGLATLSDVPLDSFIPDPQFLEGDS